MKPQPSYKGFDSTPAGADKMEGWVGESEVRAAGLGEAKHLDGAVVTPRLFTGEDVLAKQIVAICLDNARCTREGCLRC